MEQAKSQTLKADKISAAEKEEKLYDRWGPRPMLTLVFKDRSCQAFAYALLMHANMNLDHSSISLDYGFCRVQLEGERLAEHYQRIVRHAADMLFERDRADIRSTGSGVTRITVTFRSEEKPY